ncbi:inosamine-phosphate amidinotransferase 1 [Nocardia fluminea]|uniref:inosamine-phosphate amidinotransferase 1 n=1 Tax=Nocardia fluminea TaxID=134984 RepID=UPI001B8086AF|nr:inosamine-phosphate amidinotransferase 1 [Nocardia fluminea]
MNYTTHERELTFDMFLHENISGDNNLADKPWLYPPFSPPAGADPRSRIRIAQRHVDELNEDIAGLVATLESLSVRVRRPMEIGPDVPEMATPAWAAAMIPALNVRDNAIIMGDEIVETPPMMRSRYFENQLLKPVFMDYFEQGARWSVMPRPIMTDGSFDFSYADGSVSPAEPLIPIARPDDSPHHVGFEMMMDAAQILRFGRDVLVNVSTQNHELAYQWLARHFSDRFRLHRIYRLSDDHIDSTVLPLRPGLLLARSPEIVDRLPAELQKWDRIYYPEPTPEVFPAYGNDDLVLTSKYIDMNLLSIDPETVLVNSSHTAMIKLLEANGMTVVPVQHRHRRLFGGGFHCFTVDTVREGGPEDYFSG